MNYILGKDDKPVLCEDVVEWSKWFEANTHKRILGRTYITQGIHVSTVFLGIDYGSLCPNDKPVLWETMVFGMPDDWEDGYEHYRAEEEAMKGHLEMVDKVRAYLRDQSDSQ